MPPKIATKTKTAKPVVEDTSCWASIKKAINNLRIDDLSDQNTHAQNHYDTTDDWDSASLLGRAYTVYHPLEPRALIWYFLIVLPIIIAFVVAFIDQSLTAIFRLKHHHIARGMATWVGANPGKLVLCALAWGLLTSFILGCSYMWSRKIAHGTAGRGLPRVVAFLNGIHMPHWGHFRILISKIITVIITVASGVPYDFVGSINEIGAMIGACSVSRNPIYEKFVPFAKYFRNHRDSRLIVAVGIAAAASAAFKSPIGGLALLLELSAVKFNIKFLYRVFLSCNLCGFVGQLIYTHLYAFEPRESSGEWSMLPLQQIAQVTENLLTVLPAIFLGIVGGLFQGIFAMMSNFILNRPALRSIEALLFVSFVYGTTVYILTGLFGNADQCRPLIAPSDPFLAEGTPIFLHSDIFCDQVRLNEQMNVTVDVNGTLMNETEPVLFVNAFASLTLGFDSAILRILFRRRIPSFWTASELATAAGLFCFILPFLTVLSVVDGDVLMPTGLLGGCIGQLVFVIVKSWGIEKDWVDGGLFALLGAVSFISGMTRLTFSLVFLFVDFAGDVRHVLFIMLAVSVARAVADWITPVRIDYVVMKYQGFAILDFALKIEQYDSITLHEFQSRNLKVIPPACTVAQLMRLLTTSFHNSFPVIDPQSQRFIGLVHRRTLQLIVWGFSENIPEEFRHPEGTWPGLVPDGVGASLITKHAFMSAGATHSSALLSFKIEKPAAHLPRGQYESFFSDEQLVVRKNQNQQQQQQKSNTNTNYEYSPASSIRVESGSSVTNQNQNTSNNTNPTSRTTKSFAPITVEEKEAALRRMLEDYDHFDAHAAAEEFHRLRDLDDWLHYKFSEDDAELLQTARGIKPERSVMHRAFVEETAKFSGDILNTQINLVRYTDRAAFTVRAAMCISRLYNMFTVLGLRHAVIVDYNNRPTGVITRRDLMTYQIVKKKKRQEEEGVYGGGIMSTTLSEDEAGDVDYEDDNESESGLYGNHVAMGSGRESVISGDNNGESSARGGSRKPSLTALARRAGPVMSYNKGLTKAAGRFFDEETPITSSKIKSNNNNSAPSAGSQNSTQNSLTKQKSPTSPQPPNPNSTTSTTTTTGPTTLTKKNSNDGPYGRTETITTTTSTTSNQKEQEIIQIKRDGDFGGEDSPTNNKKGVKVVSPRASEIESVRSESETSSVQSARREDDAFKGRILYTVNRIRPPMLLPKGWNGSGRGSFSYSSPTSNQKTFGSSSSNNNNTGSSSPKNALQNSSSGNNNNNRNDDDDREEAQGLGSRANSYSTIVSDPGSQC